MGHSRLFASVLLLLCPLVPAQIGGALFDNPNSPLLPNTVYNVTSSIQVPPGQTLTVPQGVVLKFSTSQSVNVQGTLVVNGQPGAGNGCIFTSIWDVSPEAGGNTTSNSSPPPVAAGDWGQVIFASPSSGSMSHLQVRYAGTTAFSAAVHIAANPGLVTMSDCTIMQSLTRGLHLSGGSQPTVTGCDITDCASAISGVLPIAVPGFTNNTASLNGNNSMVVLSTVWTGPLTISENNLPLDPTEPAPRGVAQWNQLTIASGSSLTLGAGVVVKIAFGVNGATINGDLITQGTGTDPVVFTSLLDDSHGGDTNGDGPSTGGRGDWTRLRFNATSVNSDLDHTIVRFGGRGSTHNISLNTGADISMKNCVVEESAGDGIDFSSAALPSILNCAFDNCDRLPMVNALWAALPGLVDNTASGNANGDYLRVEPQHHVAGTTVVPWNYPGDVLVVDGGFGVFATGSLTLDPGVIVKLAIGATSFVNGDLTFNGNGSRPIIVTTIEDDDTVGDTANDGPPLTPGGAPRDPEGWARIIAGAVNFTARHTILRWGGRGHHAVTMGPTTSWTLDGVRVENVENRAFQLQSAGVARNCVAWRAGDDGFFSSASDVHYVYCTAVACGGDGFQQSSLSQVTTLGNSISWGNANAINNFDILEVHHSCIQNPPFALLSGNLFVNPMFVDEPMGDLRLQAGSPCVGTATRLTAASHGPVSKDAVANSRWAEQDLLGFPAQPDMGAYELVHWRLDYSGEPRGGHTVTFSIDDVQGTGGFWTLFYSVAPGAPTTLPAGLGWNLIGTDPATLFQFGYPLIPPVFARPVSSSIPAIVPGVTLDVALQAMAVAPGSAYPVGQATNVIVVRLEP